MPRKSPRPAPVLSHADTDATADEAFPDPATPSGRVLATLIGAHVPGTPATWSNADLYRRTNLAGETAEAALAELEARRIVDVQASPDGASRRLTVMLAPPLDEYGVVPSWGQAPDPDPLGTDMPAGDDASGHSSSSEWSVVRPGASGRVRPVGGEARVVENASDRASGAEETAVARQFLERVERLLVECDEWRRRALSAEDRASSLERQVRAVERRTEAIQTRLDVATDRLRAWAELSKRMQQLSRQADVLSRARGAPRPRETVETVANSGGTVPAGADGRAEDATGSPETLVANAS
ncbi:MAG: hypothetical protein EXR45_04830 [Chloroflexi bacterium]|nr:hypothetical protein [Chloroflexota bacterium]